MSWIKRLRLYYFISAVMLTIFPSTFLLMPLSNRISENDAKVVLILTGTAFWVSCISGYSLLFLAYRLSRNLNKNKGGKVFMFSNKPTCIADVLFFIGLIAFMVLVGWNQAKGYIVYIDIFVMIFAFNMHLLFSRGLYKKVGRVFKS